MAAPKRLPSGSWYITPMVNGVRQYGTFETRDEATQWQKSLRQEAKKAKRISTRAGRHRTLAEAIERYDLDHPDADRWQTERRRWWREDHGHVRLGEWSSRHVADSLAELKRTRAPATVNRYRSAISVVADHCCHPSVQWLDENPVKKVPALTEPKGRTRWIRDSERTALMEACEAVSWAGMPALVSLALATGARKGELKSLTWANVDMQASTVYLPETKNGDPRLVPVAPAAMRRLREWKLRSADIKSPLVFPSRVKPAQPFEFKKHWDAAIRAAGLDNLRFHDLRHTAGSYLAQAGLSTREIMDVMGHRTHQMAVRYQHLSDRHHDAVRKAMEDRLG